jgi:S1-C subfamily serine protease
MSRLDNDEPLEVPRRPAERGLPCGSLVLTLLIVAVTGLLAWGFWSREENGGSQTNETPQVIVARGNLKEEQKRAIAVYKKASPSVVHVTRLGARRNRLTLDLQQIPEGTGSGFVWDDKGHVVTNNHVVEGVSFGISVTLPDHSSYPAQVIDAMPDRDLAVLWIGAPKDKLRPIAVGSSHDLKVGQSAYAIGNPFGLDHSLTTGVVSALNRVIQTEQGKRISHVIQTSTAINPGNSGGPLLDGDGRLIGITSAIFSPSGAWAGVGFAIPVDEVNEAVSAAISKPRPLRAALGVTLAPPELAKQLGAKGLLILDVLPGSAAAKAGLRPTRRNEDGDIQMGDVIVAVSGKTVRTLEDIHKALAKYHVGDQVPLTIVRDGRRQTVDVQLGAAR